LSSGLCYGSLRFRSIFRAQPRREVVIPGQVRNKREPWLTRWGCGRQQNCSVVGCPVGRAVPPRYAQGPFIRPLALCPSSITAYTYAACVDSDTMRSRTEAERRGLAAHALRPLSATDRICSSRLQHGLEWEKFGATKPRGDSKDGNGWTATAHWPFGQNVSFGSTHFGYAKRQDSSVILPSSRDARSTTASGIPQHIVLVSTSQKAD
jgi:hypothetical protein